MCGVRLRLSECVRRIPASGGILPRCLRILPRVGYARTLHLRGAVAPHAQRNVLAERASSHSKRIGEVRRESRFCGRPRRPPWHQMAGLNILRVAYLEPCAQCTLRLDSGHVDVELA